MYEVRHTPAGIPIARFVLEHQSQQKEAGLTRNIFCRVLIIVSGGELNKTYKRLAVDEPVTVEGYLNQISFQGTDRKLCVNAESIRI